MKPLKQIVFLKPYSTYEVGHTMMPTDAKWMGKLIKRGIARIQGAPSKKPAAKKDAPK